MLGGRKLIKKRMVTTKGGRETSIEVKRERYAVKKTERIGMKDYIERKQARRAAELAGDGMESKRGNENGKEKRK